MCVFVHMYVSKKACKLMQTDNISFDDLENPNSTD